MIPLLGLLHLSILGYLSFQISKIWYGPAYQRVITSFMLFWANLILTALILSLFRCLDLYWLYSGISMLLQGGLFFLVRTFSNKGPFAKTSAPGYRFSRMEYMMLGILTVLAVLNLIATLYFPPNNHDSLAYHLPRIYFYFSQGHLGHFFTPDERQIFFPFNASLFQFPVIQYGFPDQILNLINYVSWLINGLLVYRISLFLSKNIKASIVSAFLGLCGTAVLAQATTTNNDILLSACLLGAIYYAFNWTREKRKQDLVLAVISAGIGVGTKVTVAYIIPGFLLFMLFRYLKSGLLKSHYSTYLKPLRARLVLTLTGLFMLLALPSYMINLRDSGHISAPSQEMYINAPWNANKAHINLFGVVAQASLNPIASFLYNGFSILDPILGTAYKHTFAFYTNQWLFNRWIEHYWDDTIKDRYGHFASNPVSKTPVEDEVWYGFTSYIILLALLLSFGKWRRNVYAVLIMSLVLSFFLCYGLLMNWQPWSSRFFLSAFVLSATISGYALMKLFEHRNKKSLVQIVATVMILVIGFDSISYVFNNYRRGISLIYKEDPIKEGYRFRETPLFEANTYPNICIVRPVIFSSDERLYSVMRNNNRVHFFQCRECMEDALNLVSLPDSTLLSNPELKEKIAYINLQFIGKHDFYWYKIVNNSPGQ